MSIIEKEFLEEVAKDILHNTHLFNNKEIYYYEQ